MADTGRLITLCGIDGVGKSVQAGRLAAALRAEGADVLLLSTVTRVDDFMPALRAAGPVCPAQTLSDLIAFERFRRVRSLVEPTLAVGGTVVCDRWFLTDVAYAIANSCLPEFALGLMDRAPAPNVKLILMAPVSVALQRIRTRSEDAGWKPPHDASFLAAASDAFERLAERPDVYAINSHGSVETVHEEILRTVQGK